jgi:hypothetical protein
MNNKYKDNAKNIYNIDLIKWAFEKGYDLASNDVKESIHIDFTETQRYFLEELVEYYNQDNL